MTVPINATASQGYDGTGTVKVYAAPFPTFDDYNVICTVADATNPTEVSLTDLVRGVDFTVADYGIPNYPAKVTLLDASAVPPGWVGPIPERQAWLTAGGFLATGFTLFVKFTPEAAQPARLADAGPRAPYIYERTMDRLTMNIKALQYEVAKALKFSDYTFFTEGDPATAEELIAEMNKLREEVEAFVNSGGALPPGGFDGAFLEGDLSDPVGAVWKSGAFEGYSAVWNRPWLSTGLEDTVAQLVGLAYLGPLVNLVATGSGAIREKGTAVTAVDLTANVTKRADPIARIRFKKDGADIPGADFNPPANLGSGATNYNWAGSFSDNSTFSVEVTDTGAGNAGVPTTVTSSQNFTFVYPYYTGCAAPGAGEVTIEALTKLVINNTNSLNRSFTAVDGDVFYFAYPKSYGNLNSIKDVNNFETIGSWTRSDLVITGLNGIAVTYNKYEFNNIQVANTTSFTFIK